MAAKRILCVCTGNSCRSVMAQALLQHKLKQVQHQLKDPVDVGSAGMFAIEGMGASKETIKLLQAEGIDASGHMARLLTNDAIKRADLILVMEQFHLDEALRRAPDARDKIKLLRQFGRPTPLSPEEANIPDPIGKPLETYEQCYATIKESIDRVVDWLVNAPA